MERLEGAAYAAPVGAVGGALLHGAGTAGRSLLDVTRARPRAPTLTPAGTPATLIDRLRAVSLIENVDARADRKILEAYDRDAIDLEDAARTAPNKPVTVIDTGGENMVGVARAAQSIPGASKQRLSDDLTVRREAQEGRITGDLERATGTQRGDVYQTAADLAAAQKARATPLYEAAFAHPDVDGPLIREAFSLPAFRQAYEAGRQIAAVRREAIPPCRTLSRRSPGSPCVAWTA